MGYYSCGLCDKESCYGCKNENIYKSPADMYRIEGYDEGYDKGYDEGYKKGHEKGNKEGYDEGKQDGYQEGCEKGYIKGRSEKGGLVCIYKEPHEDTCNWYDKPCNGCDLSCETLAVRHDW